VRVAVNVEQLLYSSPGGTGRYTSRIVTLLPRLFEGDTVAPFVAYHSKDEIAAAYRAFGFDSEGVIAPSRLPLPRPLLYEAWHRLGLPRLDRRPKDVASADLVHAPSPAVPPRGKRPLVVTIHDAAYELNPETFPRRGRDFHRRGVEAAARRADLVITVSRSAADEIATHTPIRPDRLRVVPNGVDHITAGPDDVARALSQFRLDDQPYVLWVGSLEPRKDVGTLLAVFARLSLRRDGPQHRLVLVGPPGWLGGGRINAADIERLGDRLRSLGQVDDATLRALYAGADLFAFPSLNEGFGLPVLEAMVQNTAVVCSDIPALREVSASAAHLVAPGDVDGWTDALEGLLAQPELRASLAQAGRERAALFSWERSVAATRAVYEEALGG
jgi:glycosyltransferase involved in cell wall biosynthesis